MSVKVRCIDLETLSRFAATSTAFIAREISQKVRFDSTNTLPCACLQITNRRDAEKGIMDFPFSALYSFFKGVSVKFLL